MKANHKMECGDVKGRLADWLNNQLDKNEQIAVNSHLADCLHCQDEFAADKHLWDKLGRLTPPQPSEAMRTNFYDMLEAFKEAEKPASRFSLNGIWEKVQALTSPGWAVPQWTLQVGFSLALVGLGWAIGHKTGQRADRESAYREQIETLATEVQDMKSTMMLSLLDNPSATERLRAVSYASDIPEADDRVVKALFATLNNDDNVNVRLVTLEALTQYASNAKVREGLVKSLAYQDSPMVQVALADLMVHLQEKSSVKVLRKMLQKEDLNDLVKNKIEQSIKDLS